MPVADDKSIINNLETLEISPDDVFASELGVGVLVLSDVVGSFWSGEDVGDTGVKVGLVRIELLTQLPGGIAEE